MQEASLGVPITWSVLGPAGCFKAERSWIDRSLSASAIVGAMAGIASRLIGPIEYYWFERFWTAHADFLVTRSVMGGRL